RVQPCTQPLLGGHGHVLALPLARRARPAAPRAGTVHRVDFC
ncbi:hypothetical protein A2U01_0079193, partial [Trifolium medium]|nr:hypothetical protein [Trifolium medium]